MSSHWEVEGIDWKGKSLSNGSAEPAQTNTLRNCVCVYEQINGFGNNGVAETGVGGQGVGDFKVGGVPADLFTSIRSCSQGLFTHCSTALVSPCLGLICHVREIAGS